MRLFLVIMLICLGLAGQASARTEHGVYGARGDKEATDECPAGSFMVGFVGGTGGWIDQIGVVCGKQTPDGSISGSTAIGARGGGGGSFKSVMCGKDRVISEITPHRTKNYQILHIDITCTNVKTLAKSFDQFGGKGVYDGRPAVQSCKSGEFASGMKIFYGNHVNGVGLICGDYRAVAAPPPAAPPTASLPPNSTAPIGATADYAGRWRMRTVQNADFTLTLNVSGNNVTGQFTNSANGSFDGTLSGAVTTNGRLRFTWTQPRINATGDGSFGVHTDNTLHGGLTYKAPGAVKPTYYRWAGTRISGGVATPPVSITKTSTVTETEGTDIWDKPGGTDAGAKETGKSLTKGQTVTFIGCVQAHPGWAQVEGGFVWGEHIKPGCG